MKKNKKGFTLVELLAVIVVLAIIMIIAVPQVMNAMDGAKVGAFKVEARNVIRTAMAQYQTDQLTGGSKATEVTISSKKYYCYSLSSIGMNTDKFHGAALYGPIGPGEKDPLWYVRLTDGDKMTAGLSATGGTKTVVDVLTNWVKEADLEKDEQVVTNGLTTVADADACA